MDEKSKDAKGREEWSKLSECERNCLMWPDFLVWGQTREIKVHRKDSGDGRIGLVSVAVQDGEKQLWYNMAKKIIEDSPAYNLVNPCEWVCKVDGKETTDCPNEEFSNLIRNGKKVVCLSLKEAVDPLAEFVKKWDGERIETLNLSQETDFQKRCRFVHFYSKDDSGNLKDRILVWEVKGGTGTSELILHRGEELLEVNDQRVEGKKLAEIYKLILDQASADVQLKIKAIQPNMSVEETAKHSDAVLLEKHLNGPDSSLAEDEVFSLSDEKKMDKNTGEIQKSPPQNKKKAKRPSFKKRLSRRSSSSSKPEYEDEASGSVSPSSAHNVAYTPTPPPQRKPPQRKPPMCGECVENGKSQQPDDRDNWPIYKMEIACLEEIYKLLDLDDPSSEPLMVALGGFSKHEADLIKKECMPNGWGIARKALDRWGASKSENNVGALKAILKEIMKRQDVVDVIENWKKLRVCHGCGVKLNYP